MSPQNQQQSNQSPRQSSNQNIPDINPAIVKPKIPVTMITVGIILISIVGIGAFWLGRQSQNNYQNYYPTITPIITINQPSVNPITYVPTITTVLHNPTIVNSTDIIHKNCLVDGTKYLNGEVIPKEKGDNCNECVCVNGHAACTKKMCPNMRKYWPTVIPVD